MEKFKELKKNARKQRIVRQNPLLRSSDASHLLDMEV